MEKVEKIIIRIHPIFKYICIKIKYINILVEMIKLLPNINFWKKKYYYHMDTNHENFGDA